MSATSDRQHHQRMYDVFIQACAIDPQHRDAFLTEACGSDQKLRLDVESLLAEDNAVESSMGRHSTGAGAEIGLSDLHIPRAVRELASSGRRVDAAVVLGWRMPERIGNYRIVDVLGEGGMGVVYRAEQDQPRRTVALKIIRSNYASEGMLRRFDVEAQALALLHHQGIAQIYEAGTFQSEHGPQPYFAMELIDGLPLLDYAESNKLGTRERLGLLLRLCDAVEHAHRKGVIHRDLKPGNILVVENGSSMGTDPSRDFAVGQPKILDFGVARVTNLELQATAVTQSGQILGTLAYMSPEQVAGDPRDVDTRADVYALGVIAFELLTGQLPYGLKGCMIHEAARVIQEEDPTPLSSVNRVYRGDLNTILAKSLEKHRDRRYASAAALAEDIRRYLHDEPIFARKPSALYQLQKFARRNKTLVGGIIAVFLVLVVGIIGTGYGMRRALVAAELAADREMEAIAARDAEVEQRALLEQREHELRDVVAFQGESLAAISPEVFGQSVVTTLRQRLASALAAGDRSDDEVERDLDQFDAVMLQVNSTDMARDLLEEHLLRRTAEAIEEAFVEQPRVAGTLRGHLALAYHSLGRLPEALHHAEPAAEILRRELGPDDPESISAVSNLAIILRAMGNYDRAETLHREVFERRSRVLGPHNADTIDSMINLSSTLRSLGRFDEAEAQCRSAMESARQELGEEHVASLRALVQLAVIVRDLGRAAEAVSYLRKVLEVRRSTLGDTHADTISVMANLAGIFIELRQYDESERLYQELLEYHTRTLGEDHPKTLRTFNNLATLQLRMGRLDQAEYYYRRAVDGRRRSLGDDHPGTLLSQMNLAKVMQLQGRLNEAETMLSEALAGLRLRLGDDHTFTLATSGTLGVVLREQGHFERAELLLQATLDGFRRTLGENHLYTLTAMDDLGQLYFAADDPHRADAMFVDAVSHARSLLPAEHPDLAMYLLHHGRSLIRLRRFKEAEAALREAMDIYAQDESQQAQRDDVADALIELHAEWNDAEPDRGFDEEGRRGQDKSDRNSG